MIRMLAWAEYQQEIGVKDSVYQFLIESQASYANRDRSSHKHNSEEEYEDFYDEEDSMLDAEDCPSEYDEWLIWSKKRTRLKQKWKERSNSE